MPVEPYPTVTIGGTEYWEVDVKARVAKESDPNSRVFFFFATPAGGAANLGPLVKGDPGKHTEFQTAVDFTSLAYGDPTPASASIVEVTPGGDTVSQVVKLALALHEGPPGEPGDTVLDPEDYSETPVYGQQLAVNSATDAFELITPKVGEFYWPAVVNNTPSGNANYTLGSVSTPAFGFDCRIIPFGYTIITGTGANVAVDFIARLNGETAGNIIGRCPGLAGATDRLTMVPGPVAGADNGINRVLAGNTSTTYFRVERQSGSDTYTTSATTTRFGVMMLPILSSGGSS